MCIWYIAFKTTVFPRLDAAATIFFPSAETSGNYSRAATITSLVFADMLTYSSTINSMHVDTV